MALAVGISTLRKCEVKLISGAGTKASVNMTINQDQEVSNDCPVGTQAGCCDPVRCACLPADDRFLCFSALMTMIP